MIFVETDTFEIVVYDRTIKYSSALLQPGSKAFLEAADKLTPKVYSKEFIFNNK
jgi:hypothetical protein